MLCGAALKSSLEGIRQEIVRQKCPSGLHPLKAGGMNELHRSLRYFNALRQRPLADRWRVASHLATKSNLANPMACIGRQPMEELDRQLEPDSRRSAGKRRVGPQVGCHPITDLPVVPALVVRPETGASELPVRAGFARCGHSSRQTGGPPRRSAHQQPNRGQSLAAGWKAGPASKQSRRESRPVRPASPAAIPPRVPSAQAGPPSSLDRPTSRDTQTGAGSRRT
jgi:hypothetical protein